MATKGKRANWMSYYQGDRPRDIIGLTEAQEATIAGFYGFVGRNQAKEVVNQFFMLWDGAAAPTLTDYATSPIGTRILCTKLADIDSYVHVAQSTTPVIGDWQVVTRATVT